MFKNKKFTEAVIPLMVLVLCSMIRSATPGLSGTQRRCPDKTSESETSEQPAQTLLSKHTCCAEGCVDVYRWLLGQCWGWWWAI